jgi:aminodeoxyfutalosine deaminase
MFRMYRAAWVLPIDAPPIRNGWVAVDGGLIRGVGASDDGNAADHDPVAILPALVNAHAHLELSWMRGRVEPGTAMPAWAARLIATREGDGGSAGEAVRRAAIGAAIDEMRATGTGLVGDVGNTMDACEPLVASGMSAVLFHELLGFRAADPAAQVEAARQRIAALPARHRVRATLAPHAPYSVSPALFQAIGAAAAGGPLSVHLGESAEEIRFLRDGTGAWRELLERLGAWTPEWTPPACGPVEFVERLGLLNEWLLAVHGVQFDAGDLQRLAAADATLVTCPRSNRWTGAGTPPLERIYASGVRVAIGTDSLASVEDLNLFNEMAAVRRLAASVAARQILRSATLDGARALGFGDELGSLTPQKRADLIAVRIPRDVVDVEEYLVGGSVDRVEWLS